MKTIKIKGELEIDVNRGVVYFHSNETGVTVLRASGLHIPSSFGEKETNSIDINVLDQVSYS